MRGGNTSRVQLRHKLEFQAALNKVVQGSHVAALASDLKREVLQGSDDLASCRDKSLMKVRGIKDGTQAGHEDVLARTHATKP